MHAVWKRLIRYLDEEMNVGGELARGDARPAMSREHVDKASDPHETVGVIPVVLDRSGRSHGDVVNAG
jgi:hypothetical protein